MKAGKRSLSDIVKQGNWATTVALVVVGVAFLYFWFIPNRRAIEGLRGELQVQHDLAAQEPIVRLEVEKTQRKMQAAETFVASWKRSAPREADVAAMYGTISEALADAGCQTQSFVPRDPQAMAHLRRIPIELAVQGDLAGLFDALGRIEKLPAEIWIESLSIKKPERQDLLRSEASLVIFSENSDKSD